VVAAVASWFSGARPPVHESVGAELAAEAGELVRDDTERESARSGR